MLMKYLDTLVCPKCGMSKRLWKIQGDYNDSRVATAIVACPDNHNWQVMEDILRLDKEESEEEMIFLDHPRTGFPSEVSEDERGEFLVEYNRLISDLAKGSDQPLMIKGEPILFFKYMPEIKRDLIVIHENEGILRQVQELAAKKRMYNQISCIRADDASFIDSSIQSLIIFPEKDLLDKLEGKFNVITLDPTIPGDTKWSGKSSSLVYAEF